MKKALEAKFGRVVQQDYGVTRRPRDDLTADIPSVLRAPSSKPSTQKSDEAVELAFPPQEAMKDGDPVVGRSVRRILVCSFIILNGCPLYMLLKYPASELICPDLMVFPFCHPTRFQSPIGDVLDEFGADLGIDQEGYSGWMDHDGDMVLFFMVRSGGKLPVGPVLWAVAPDEIANVGAVHGFPIHDSVRKVLEVHPRLLSGTGPAMRVFYGPTGCPLGVTQLSPLDRTGSRRGSMRLLLPYSNAKYAFGCPSDVESIYQRLWSAWRSGHGFLYASGSSSRSWYCRDPEAAVLRSEV